MLNNVFKGPGSSVELDALSCYYEPYFEAFWYKTG